MNKDSGIVNIHGKEYQTVAYRVGKFREAYRDYTLQTEVLERTEDVVVMKATILNEQGRLIATGHSEEYRKSSQINKTSALENAETSAIGRALAAFGLGGTEFATADEVANAIVKQKPSMKTIARADWDELDTDNRTLCLDMEKKMREIAAKSGWVAANKHLLDDTELDVTLKSATWSRFTPEEKSQMRPRKAA